MYGKVRGQQQQEVVSKQVREERNNEVELKRRESSVPETVGRKLPEGSASRHLDLRWMSSGEATGGGSPEDQSEGRFLWRPTTKESCCLRGAFLGEFSVRLTRTSGAAVLPLAGGPGLRSL